MADVVFYPDADPESTSVDGRVFRTAGNSVWSGLVTGDGTGSFDDGTMGVFFQAHSNTDRWSLIIRVILLFDTSTLSDDSDITGATLTVTPRVLQNTLGVTPAVNVVDSSPVSDTALQNSDYQTMGSTLYATEIAYSSLVVDTEAEFTLNATGLAAIQKNGITKFGLRESNYDIPNNIPTWSASKLVSMFFYSADETKTEPQIAKRPRLTVIYSPIVTTQAVTEIEGTTATGNGNIVNLGGPTVTQHGHCWKVRVDETTTPPTTSDSKTENGEPSATGAFTSSLTGLTVATPYLIRAYATNTEGTAYGEQVTFIAGAPTAGDRAGPIRIVETRLHYVDAYGVERWLKGTVV